MRSLDCYRAVPVAENTPQFADKETYDAVVLVRNLKAVAGFVIVNFTVSASDRLPGQNCETSTAPSIKRSPDMCISVLVMAADRYAHLLA